MRTNLDKLSEERRLTTRHPLQLCLLLVFMVSGWAGCKHDAKVAADPNPSGTYALVSVDGHTLPYTMQHEGAVPTIKFGTFTFNPDGTCSSKIVFSLPSGGDSSREVKAAYTRQGAKLTMRWEGTGTTTGTVDGDTFSMNNEGMVFAYHR